LSANSKSLAERPCAGSQDLNGDESAPGRIIYNIESDDVKGDFDRFKGAGTIVIREPYDFEQAPGAWIATFADPDDNYFQLMSPFDPASMGSSSG
jgi:predicted enzyme related to lactoylglutathione lyase